MAAPKMVRACTPARIALRPLYGNASLLPVAANGSSDWHRPACGAHRTAADRRCTVPFIDVQAAIDAVQIDFTDVQAWFDPVQTDFHGVQADIDSVQIDSTLYSRQFVAL